MSRKSNEFHGKPTTMKILLTNDDGIYAPGLAALERALRRLGEVYVVAPTKEQSGVSHSITFLTPLQVKKVYVDDDHWGWTVDGTPADCVKLGITEIMPDKPDLVVSGINCGLNAGINILYSGTVAAAREGAFYGITSVAVSLEYSEHEPFHRAANVAAGLIENLLIQNKGTGAKLYNINMPLSALKKEPVEVRAVGMDVTPYWDGFEQRMDPMGRAYYWLTGKPGRTQSAPPPASATQTMPSTATDLSATDLKAVLEGYVTVTPLQYDMTNWQQLEVMQQWLAQGGELSPRREGHSEHDLPHTGPTIRTTR